MISEPKPGPDPLAVPPPPWLATRLSVQMFLSFAVQGAWVPVFSVYLQQLDFSPAAVAWAFTAYSFSSLVTPLVWGQIADRWIPAERCISFCALINAVALAGIPYLESPAAMFLACVTFWFFMIPVNSLGTALTLRQLDHPERSFGRVRLWGTIGWMAAGWLVTWWLHELKPIWFDRSDGPALADSFWIGALFAAVLAVYTLTLPSSPPTRLVPFVDMPPAGLRGLQRLFDAPLMSLRLFRRRMFVTYCVCLFGFYLTYPFSAQMTPLLLERLGIQRSMLPLVLTASQTTEVATLAMLPWLLGRLAFRATMLVGIGAWTAGVAAFVVGQPVSLVLAAVTMQGLFIACFLVAGQVFVNRHSAPDFRASAQGLMVLIAGAGLLGGHLLVGWIRLLTEDDFHLAFLPAAIASVVLIIVFLTGFTAQTAVVREEDALVSSQEMT
jgi:MFS family permease